MNELVELDEEGGVGHVFDHGHDAAGVAVALFALEGKGCGGEDNGRDSVVGEMLCYFKRRSAAGASAQGGDDNRQPDAFDMFIDAFNRVFCGEPPGDDISACAAPGESVAAD